MNTEQLRMIIDLLTSLGVQGKDTFIWYIVFTEGLRYLTYFAWIGIVLFLVQRGYSLVSIHKDLQEIRDTLNIGYPGTYSHNEHKEVIRKLKSM